MFIERGFIILLLVKFAINYRGTMHAVKWIPVCFGSGSEQQRADAREKFECRTGSLYPDRQVFLEPPPPGPPIILTIVPLPMLIDGQAQSRSPNLLFNR